VWLVNHRVDFENPFQLCFGKRPAEELYDLQKDPDQIVNVAGKAEYAPSQTKLRARLDEWMRETADPRAIKDDDHWDQFRYYGGAANRTNR
jgi:N-sulfoglucosamine sulfohydrolase